MAWYDKRETDQNKGTPYPGKQGSTSILSSFSVHAPGKHVEVTVAKGANGEPRAVFVRPLFLGIF